MKNKEDVKSKKGVNRGVNRNRTGTEAGLQKGTEVGKEFRFKPGKSGNPAGRPRLPFTAALRELYQAKKISLDLDFEDANGVITKRYFNIINNNKSVDFYKILSASVLAAGLKGNLKAGLALMDREEGKAAIAIKELGSDVDWAIASAIIDDLRKK